MEWPQSRITSGDLELLSHPQTAVRLLVHPFAAELTKIYLK